VSLTRPGAAAPVFGAAWFTAHVTTDRDTRIVTIREVTVKDVRVPAPPPPSSRIRQRDRRALVGGGGDLPAGSN